MLAIAKRELLAYQVVRSVVSGKKSRTCQTKIAAIRGHYSEADQDEGYDDGEYRAGTEVWKICWRKHSNHEEDQSGRRQPQPPKQCSEQEQK